MAPENSIDRLKCKKYYLTFVQVILMLQFPPQEHQPCPVPDAQPSTSPSTPAAPASSARAAPPPPIWPAASAWPAAPSTCGSPPIPSSPRPCSRAATSPTPPPSN